MLQREWGQQFKDKGKVVDWPEHCFEHFLIVVRTSIYTLQPDLNLSFYISEHFGAPLSLIHLHEWKYLKTCIARTGLESNLQMSVNR